MILGMNANGINIGISTASYFNKLEVEDALLDIRAHGVSVCEVFLNSFCEYQPEFIDVLCERIALNNLQVFSIHPMSTQYEPMLFSQHDRQRGDAWKLFELVLQGAKKLGATHYVMHGPANLSGSVKHSQLERAIPTLGEAIAIAASFGVVLTLENVSWCLFRQPEDGFMLKEALGGKLKFTLDIKQAIRAGSTPEAFIAAVGDDIENVHLCDAIMLPDGRPQFKMPGFGTVDFDSIRDALKDHGYVGPAFIEVYGDMYQDISRLYESLDRMNLVFGA